MTITTQATVITLIGKAKVHAPAYVEADWDERDNFETLEQAQDFGAYKSHQYPLTPYRIVRYEPEVRAPRELFALEFVPEYKLR